MTTNTAETLSRGMEILSEHMGIIEAERFLFLVKSEGFDYTAWQQDYFENKTKTELDNAMDAYFSEHPHAGDDSKLL